MGGAFGKDLAGTAGWVEVVFWKKHQTESGWPRSEGEGAVQSQGWKVGNGSNTSSESGWHRRECWM